MVLMDTFGLTLFVPLLQIAEGNNLQETAHSNNLFKYVHYFFSTINLEITVVNMLLVIVTLFILKGIFFFFSLSYRGGMLQQFSGKIRSNLAVGIRDLNYKKFVSADIGQLQNSLNTESWKITLASSLYLEVIKEGLFVLVYLSFAFFIDWKFSIIIVIGGIFTNLFYKQFYKRTQELSRNITKNSHRYGSIVIELINHYKYLKATGRNFLFTRLLNNELNSLVKNTTAVVTLEARLVAIREPIMIIIIAIAMLAHIFIFKSSLSSIIVILLLFYRSMQMILDLQKHWNDYISYTGTVESMHDLQQYLDENKEDFRGKKELVQIEKISLKQLNLSYNDFRALTDINLEINRNQSIALVGESGSGKTSLVNIICTLIPFDSGTFEVNNVPLHEIANHTYKQKIGYISQESTVFNATLFENISFWDEKSKVNLAKFEQVIDMCSLRKFYTALDEKENTLLGNNGINISGGQKQRISIARELYRDVDILIMDEATSALDSETEKEIKENIDLLKGKVTMIAIAHRLSTIKHVDVIYLMDAGRITDKGNFEALKKSSIAFKNLCGLQGI